MNTDQKINLYAVLEDIQDQLLTELTPGYKQGMKQLCNQAAQHTKKLIRSFDNIHSEKNQELFGIAADELRNKIEEWIEEI
jgi:hypothetical protein